LELDKSATEALRLRGTYLVFVHDGRVSVRRRSIF
jgi:hypothetical protein